MTGCETRKLVALIGLALLSLRGAVAQIPDLLTAFDAGGRAMGLGGSIYGAGADNASVGTNPAALGFMDGRLFSIAFRNLPGSNTAASGTFANPNLTTRQTAGGTALSHMGYSMPMGRGMMGISYNVAGFIRDFKVSNGNLTLPGGASVQNYREVIRLKTDLITIAFGAATNSGTATWGAGIVLAQQYLSNLQTYELVPAGGSPTPNPPLNVEGTGVGIGLVVGMQFLPPGIPNTSIGLSLASPITISNSNVLKAYYDKIPARATASIARRMDGMRGGRDYIVFGTSVDAFFGGRSGATYSQRHHFAVGAGLEYNYGMGNARIPVRIGFKGITNPKRPFKEYSAMTFGIGYRPLNGRYSVDLNFGAPTGGGGRDMAVGFTYKLDK